MRLGAQSAPSSLRSPAPDYPREDRLAGHEGTVLLIARIELNGLPSQVKIATSSGFARLDASALATVSKHWRFSPALRSGVPRAAQVIIPIRFALTGKKRVS